MDTETVRRPWRMPVAAARGELARAQEGSEEYDSIFANIVSLKKARRELESFG